MQLEARGAGTQRMRQPVRALLALLVFCAVPAKPTSDGDDRADAEGSSREQCLKIVDPVMGYVLTLDDHQSMPFLLRVNCPGLGAVSHLRLDPEHGGGAAGGEWWGPEDLRAFGLAAHEGASADGAYLDEMLQLDVLAVRRGRVSFAFSLRRQGQDALERAEVPVRAGALFDPRLRVDFPPRNFVFKGAVPAFVLLSVSEPAHVAETLGGGDAEGHKTLLKTLARVRLDVVSSPTSHQAPPHPEVGRERAPGSSATEASPVSEAQAEQEGFTTVASVWCKYWKYCETPQLGKGLQELRVSLYDEHMTRYVSHTIPIWYPWLLHIWPSSDPGRSHPLASAVRAPPRTHAHTHTHTHTHTYTGMIQTQNTSQDKDNGNSKRKT